MTIDRWTVRECEVHGLLVKPWEDSRHAGRLCCPICYRTVSEPFDVVRAVGARSSDPDTSRLAALRHAPRSGSQRARILDALRFGDYALSARQIEMVTGIKGAWKRISELKQGGHIVEAGVEHDPVTNMEVTVYALAAQASQDAAPGEGSGGGEAPAAGQPASPGSADGADVAGATVPARGDDRAGAGHHQQLLLGEV